MASMSNPKDFLRANSIQEKPAPTEKSNQFDALIAESRKLIKQVEIDLRRNFHDFFIRKGVL